MRRGVVPRNRDYVFCLPCRLPEGASRCLTTIVSTSSCIRNLGAVQTGTLFAPKPPPEVGLRERKVTASEFVNGAQSSRHDTAASPWRDGCARSEHGEAGPRSSAGWQNDPSDGQPAPAGAVSGARTRRAPGRSCRRKGKWPRRLHRRRTLGANCPAALGAVFEVTAFDGWSLRSPAEAALETWPG